jgi:triosephosphate isomerase
MNIIINWGLFLKKEYMKKLIFAANWKLNKNPQQTRAFFADFAKFSLDFLVGIKNTKKVKVLIFPPATNWEAASQGVIEINKNSGLSEVIGWGAQNVYPELSGAFTGENSMQVLADLGGQYSLVGHSERRTYFHETDDFLNKKIIKLQEQNITPVFCIGESLQERESGQTEKVLEKQLRQGLSNVKNENLILAYEPVWAIGTGKVASLEQVRETHAFVKKMLSDLNLSLVPILYGGSVKADNSKDLIAIENVNGFLVGGASLEVKSFSQIIENGVK